MNNNFYISTSIAYVNWAPHLWFTLEAILADTLARQKRLKWDDVFFLTWTDEHWIKIFKTAEENWLNVKQFCDMNSEKFKKLGLLLNLSNSDFIRTSDQQRHWPTVEWIWNKLVASWDIYKKHYDWLYCEWCECFLWKKDLEDWLCPNHKKEPVKIWEENYFFSLSKYSNQILELIKSDKLKIVPAFRKNEILTMLEWDGLKDVSFSRPASSLPWWVPVPWDPSQNMYVWCDALTNYISGLDAVNSSDNFNKYWVNWEKVHCIWKDIVRFHAWIWIWMLMSAQVKLPNYIHVHWFLTSEGHKMSKSIWNVVDPFEIVDLYWIDAIRYYLLREVPTWRDADFNIKHFEVIFNAHLVNGLWNLVNRVVVMSKKNWVKPGNSKSTIFKNEIESTWNKYLKEVENLDTHTSLLEAWSLVDFWNKQMDELKPWVIVKENEELFKETMKDFLELIRHISYLLSPFIPNAAERIFKILNLNISNSLDIIKTHNGQDNEWSDIWEIELLFEKIEE